MRYSIYPVVGKEACRYLLDLGCFVTSDELGIPDHLVVTRTDNGAVYAVMRGNETVFCLQYYSSRFWSVIVPLSYRVTFSELIRSYNLSDVVAAGIIGSYGVLLQMMGGVPVQRAVVESVLKRLSDYTKHPYDLNNVKVALVD